MRHENAIFDASIFSDDLFQELHHMATQVDLHKQASLALNSILTIQSERGEDRTYETIRIETEQFFANPWVAQDMAMVTALAAQYAHFCNDHGQSAMTVDHNSLAPLVADRPFDSGLSLHDHQHDIMTSHSHGETEDEANNKQQSTRKKRKRFDMYAWLLKIWRNQS